MAVTNVVFELGPDVTIVGPDNTVLLSPISGASLNVVPQPAGTTATGSIAIDSSASLNFTLNIPAGTPGGKGDDGNDGVGVSTITATQSEVVAGSPTTITFDFGMSDHSTKQITTTIPAGAQGDAGDDGISAYQVAVNNGFTGTETAWLASLVGATGESAYQAAVDGGFVGTQADWIASLKGEKGDPGPIGPIADTTDWTTQIPINARSALAKFAAVASSNTFIGNQKINGSLTLNSADNTGSSSIYVDGNSASDFVIETNAGDTSPNFFVFKKDGTSSSSINGNTVYDGVANTFLKDQTINSANLHIVNGSLLLANPSGDDVAIYTDVEGAGISKNDLVFRTNTGSNPIFTSISNTGDINSTIYGNAVFENRQNTFFQAQRIRSGGSDNPLLITTDTGDGFEYGIDDGVSFIDFHTTSSNNDFDTRIISSGGIAGTSGRGTLDFEASMVTWNSTQLATIAQLPFSDTNLRIQAFTHQGNGSGQVYYPVAFRSGTVPYVVMTINNEPGLTSRFAAFNNSGNTNTPDINNAYFSFQPVFTNDHSDTSGQDYTLQVIAVGYF